jgi:hypothetical protein
MTIVSYPGTSRGGGTGPEDPELEQRVGRIERILERLEPKISEVLLSGAKQVDVQNIRADVQTLRVDVQNIRVDLAEVKGKVSNLPTWWMMVITIIATWSAGTGIGFALIKAAHP